MFLKRLPVQLALILLLAALASLPMWASLPLPDHALPIAGARCETGCVGTVELPARLDPSARRVGYRVEFTLEDVPARPVYLFVPLFTQRMVVTQNGREIADTGPRTLMTGVVAGQTTLLHLPADSLRAGRNTLDLALYRTGLMPGYLSEMYVGTSGQLTSHYLLRLFLLEHLRLMAVATQLLVALAVLVAWIYRPREVLFGWMLLLLVLSLLSYAGLLVQVGLAGERLPLYAFLLNAGVSGVLPIVALLVNRSAVPRWLRLGVVAAPAAGLLLPLGGIVGPPAAVLGFALPLMVASVLVTLAVAAWGVWKRRIDEAWLLFLSLLPMAMSTVYDALAVTGMIDGPVLLTVYYRQALTLGFVVILARRLGLSLRQLDRANANLALRLREQETELAQLHASEREKAAQRVRGEERQRLTADLHDGLSGHLASIIALAEREQAGAIESSAREALDDLRAVIYSLDIGDRELGAALGSFRERLQRQCRRLGVELEWSMAALPEISGVTPTHVLNVLRIMQEAVTNAVRHGPATRIVLRGQPGEGGQACLTVENDGAPFAPGMGFGLANMRRRAALLGGALRIEAREAGTRVVLCLPCRLPDSRPDGGGDRAPA